MSLAHQSRGKAIDPLERSHTAPKFAAANPGDTARWYVEHLDFPHHAVFDNGNYAIVRRESLTLHLWKCDNSIIPENTSCYVELRDTSALNELHASLLKNAQKSSFAPGRIEKKPVDAEGHGMREFHVWDPNGNLIGFGAAIQPS